jgi:hypothetical protein
MDRINGNEHDYRELLRAIVQEYATTPIAAGNEQVEDLAICDDASGNYLHFSTGWQDSARIYGPVVHLRIKDDQVIIEANWTEDDLVERLVAGGVPRAMIALGWVLPEPQVAS